MLLLYTSSWQKQISSGNFRKAKHSLNLKHLHACGVLNDLEFQWSLYIIVTGLAFGKEVKVRREKIDRVKRNADNCTQALWGGSKYYT